MKKKIVADLTSLAHRILQLKENEDVAELQATARELYERLTVLVYIEKHLPDSSSTTGNKDVEDKFKKAFKDDQQEMSNLSEDADSEHHNIYSTTTNSLTDLEVPEDGYQEEIDVPGISTIQKMVFEMPDAPIENPSDSDKDEEDAPVHKTSYSTTTNSLTDLEVSEDDDREEMDLPGMSTIQKMVVEMPNEVPDAPSGESNTIKKHDKTNLEQLTVDFQTMPVFERKSIAQEPDKPKSLNSKLNTGVKMGMNDRMGFVKHLFNGSNQDFNRVLSQLNTINSYDEAQNFIHTMIKPDYNNWEGKESYESRFMDFVERQFQ
ncbi:hypothetical protein [Nonlabens marinus]|uniref:Uncharacterized protein n=1 Tax=Nonlabens marinus S1-08 TaxID=1454201 RepID=W8VUQ0_9FLAO|nr:hypothetical protein [Nonlabens marinus]BAO54788.1 hypothetical protein NMS_0779 [Nonlabens marinus S1-08]